MNPPNFPFYPFNGLNQQPPVPPANVPFFGMNPNPMNIPFYGFNQQPPGAPANFPFGMNPYPMYNPYWGRGFFPQQPAFPFGWPTMPAPPTPAPHIPRHLQIRSRAATPLLYACSKRGCGETFGSRQQLRAHKEAHRKEELNARVTEVRLHFRRIGSDRREYTPEHWENLKKICVLLKVVPKSGVAWPPMPSNGPAEEWPVETTWHDEDETIIGTQQSKNGMDLIFCAKEDCMHVSENVYDLFDHLRDAHGE